jgi:hypothetical protein
VRQEERIVDFAGREEAEEVEGSPRDKKKDLQQPPQGKKKFALADMQALTGLLSFCRIGSIQMSTEMPPIVANFADLEDAYETGSLFSSLCIV